MKIKLFWKEECPKCPEAKQLLGDAPNVEMYNLDDVDGLSEGAFYGVLATPSIIVCEDSGRELTSFRGEVPSRQQMAEWIVH
jgi:hypothetical protein